MSAPQLPPPLSYSSGHSVSHQPAIQSPTTIVSPGSTSSLYASPDSAHQPFYLAKSEPADDGASTGSSVTGGSSLTEPLKKKQKRNKPTLSCYECVERKTKCDRGRPHCLACIKRQTDCRYAHVANLLEETTRSATNGRRMTRPPKKKLSTSGIKPNLSTTVDSGTHNEETAARAFVASSTGLYSNTPLSHPPPHSNVFGVGSEHPFANYWTCEGGLPEVIGVLPEKLQADILLSQYFECVDPVYPMVHSQNFHMEYERFWMTKDTGQIDASFLALIFVMLALGTQFVSTTSPRDRKQSAEFYASAGNQALRIGSYLSTASVYSLQAMILLGYFLINDNHASDGWAFAGIIMRQAYAMGLHRDPNLGKFAGTTENHPIHASASSHTFSVAPDATPFEKQQRRKLWQAVLLQDTFLTVLLSLPPSATHTDVKIDDFAEHAVHDDTTDPTDTAYIKGSWQLANLVQETICSPQSLDLPICSTQRQKSKLIADFRGVYRSFPDVFRSWDQDSIAQLASSNKRVARQTLFLSSNYYHNLMLVHSSESADVPVNIRATLEAAHEAITAFFVLFTLFDTEARVWWVFNHRAFLEALCIGGVLREASRDPATVDLMTRDPLFSKAKADITRMIQIMKIMSEGNQGSEIARTRVNALSEYL
ncbi:fungal-specific transcription factor domain-containing protein [Xylariaceae sp. FL1019]|nr:fungal-specific transcription factor domain-containing protein [Xylariaceae sp. FL1019]